MSDPQGTIERSEKGKKCALRFIIFVYKKKKTKQRNIGKYGVLLALCRWTCVFGCVH
jgi:hypothetical protein